MKKASDILLLLGAVLSFVSLIGLLIAGIILFVFASPAFTQVLIDGVNNGTVHSSAEGTPEEIAAFVQSVLLAVGIIMFVCMVPIVVSAVFALRARKYPDTTHLIVALVLAIIFGGNLVIVIGAILGLVEDNNQKKGIQQ